MYSTAYIRLLKLLLKKLAILWRALFEALITIEQSIKYFYSRQIGRERERNGNANPCDTWMYKFDSGDFILLQSEFVNQ